MEKCFLYNECNHKDCEAGFCLRKYKLERLYEDAMIAPLLRTRVKLILDANKADLQAFQQLKEISQNICSFVQNGKSLFLHSSISGNGKTTWAIRLVQDYFNEIWPKADSTCHALYISVPRFLIALKDSIRNTSEYVDYVKANIMSADLVIWDDIAAKAGTEYEINQLLGYIDGRIALGKSNIYTSNITGQAMYDLLGSRLASRVANMSTDIEFKGADKRALNK